MHQQVPRFARRAAAIGLAASATIVLSATSAQAVTWHGGVPALAGDTFVMAHTVLSDRKTHLYVQSGTYKNNLYLWGQVTGPATDYNALHDLVFGVSGGCMDGSSEVTKDINRMTNSSATKDVPGCTYTAKVVKRPTGEVVASATYRSRTPR